MRKILGLERNVFFLGLVSMFNDFSAEMVQSVMPIFLTSVLGAPIIFVGIIEGVADALASFLKIFSGWFSDKIKKRKLPAVMGYVLSVLVRPFLALVMDFWQVFGLRVIDRVGKGVRDAPRDALISESSPRAELGKSFGYHRMMDTLGASLGPLSAFFLLPFLFGDFRKLFLIAFGIGVFSILSFFFIREVRPVVVGGAENIKNKLNFDILKRNKAFTLFLFATFVFDFGALPVALVLLRAKEIGLPGETIPLFYFIFSLAFVIAAVPLGKLSDRIGQRAVIMFGFGMAIVAYVGFIFFNTPLGVGAMFVVLGMYGAGTDGVRRALASKLVDAPVLATGQGLLHAAVGIAALLAGVIGGALWNYVGSYAAFIYAATMSCVGLFIFTRLTQGNNLHEIHPAL